MDSQIFQEDQSRKRNISTKQRFEFLSSELARNASHCHWIEVNKKFQLDLQNEENLAKFRCINQARNFFIKEKFKVSKKGNFLTVEITEESQDKIPSSNSGTNSLHNSNIMNFDSPMEILLTNDIFIENLLNDNSPSLTTNTLYDNNNNNLNLVSDLSLINKQQLTQTILNDSELIDKKPHNIDSELNESHQTMQIDTFQGTNFF